MNNTNGLLNSGIGQGLIKLLNDASSAVVVAGPIVGGIAAGVCLIRRSMADDQDGKMWEGRAKVAVFCGVAVGLVGALISLISGYF